MTNQMKQFHTRQRAQEGKRIPLSLPDGTETEHWVLLRGVDSDAYHDAVSEARKRVMEAAIDGKKESVTDEMGDRNKLLVKLIAGWSFEEECTEENVLNFLKEAPQIAERLDDLATNRRYFFASEGKGS